MVRKKKQSEASLALGKLTEEEPKENGKVDKTVDMFPPAPTPTELEQAKADLKGGKRGKGKGKDGEKKPDTRRVVAKDDKNAWPVMMQVAQEEVGKLSRRNCEKIMQAHTDSKDVDSPPSQYRFGFTVIIDDADPHVYKMEVKISYPYSKKVSFSARAKDSSAVDVVTDPDMFDEQEGVEDSED